MMEESAATDLLEVVPQVPHHCVLECKSVQVGLKAEKSRREQKRASEDTKVCHSSHTAARRLLTLTPLVNTDSVRKSDSILSTAAP